MTIENVIREQRDVIEGLWWESVQDWPASTREGRAGTAARLRERLDALCAALAGECIPRAMIERHAIDSLGRGNGPPHIVWDYALLERCVYQVWATANGGWPSLDEARRLRAVLHEAVSIAVGQMIEAAMREEHLAVRRALDAVEWEARAAFDQDPSVTMRACLGAIRNAFGAPAKTAILIVFDQGGAPDESVWAGDEVASDVKIAELARQVSHESEVIEVSLDEFSFGSALLDAGIRSLIARSVRLDDEVRGALVIGLAEPPSGFTRRLLATIADRVADVLAVARRHQGTRQNVHHLTDERSLRERFVATLAHDLRGPLTVAKISVDLLRQKAPAAADYAQRASRSIDRALTMLRDLLDAGRVHAGLPLPLDLGDCDLTSLIVELVDEQAALHGPRFIARVESGLHGDWDGRELRRALWNLLANALQHGTPGRPIEVEAVHDGGEVRIAVHNEGSPIAPSALAGIFDPYRRLGGRGWGLGLTLVRACAEAHGGTIAVASADGHTTFTLRLPSDSRPYYDELVRRSEEIGIAHEVRE